MGQKVNPTSLRLHPKNKHFDSSWFSEKQYANSIHKSFNVEIYYNAILKQIQYPSASFFFEATPRKSRVCVLFLNPTQLREQTFRSQFNYLSDRKKGAALRRGKTRQNTLFLKENKKTLSYGLKGETAEKFSFFKELHFFPLRGETGGYTLQKGANILGSKMYTLQTLSEKVAPALLHSPTLLELHLASQDVTARNGLLGKKPTTNKTGSCKLKLPPLSPSYFFTAPFLQSLKKRGPLGEGKNTAAGLRFMKVDLQDKYFQSLLCEGPSWHSKERTFYSVKCQQTRLMDILQKGVSHPGVPLLFSPSSNKKQIEGERMDSSCQKQEKAFITSQSKVDILQNKMYRRPFDFQSKKNVCSSLLGLTIFQYFVQRKESGNFLPATSRFLLLQGFSNLLKTPEHLTKPNVRAHFANQGGMFDFKNVTRSGVKKGYTFFPNLKKSSSYTYHTESLISSRCSTSCRTFFFRARNVTQSALFLAEEVVFQLQRRRSFRQIKTRFLQELGNKATIKGVRVTCVGRIGGRAKKAQRARGESFKMGQTSLHLFDSKVSFASKTGLTPFGAVGVKVWVCWK